LVSRDHAGQHLHLLWLYVQSGDTCGVDLPGMRQGLGASGACAAALSAAITRNLASRATMSAMPHSARRLCGLALTGLALLIGAVSDAHGTMGSSSRDTASILAVVCAGGMLGPGLILLFGKSREHR
jgi:drug/metabolite transporter (DMT)-like permease